MSSSPAQMNAKERRKLQRQQQQQEQGQAAAETVKTESRVKSEPTEIVKTEAPTTADADTVTTTLNAKERRKLLRQQQQPPAVEDKTEEKEKKDPVAKNGAPPATPAVATGERLNAKERRLLQRKEVRGEDPTASSKKDTAQSGKKRKRKQGDPAEGKENADDDTKRKRIHLTLFVGQLPYKCTESAIRKHFHEAGDIQLRMLTDKKTKKFKGTAFIEVQDSKALGAALSRHHSLLNGRRINVELTASGGGTKSELRKGKIDGLRKKQSEKQIEKTRALVQKCIDAPGSKLKTEDVDERMIDFLSWFDYETAKLAMDEYNRCVSDRVKNTKAFFMGILKRFRQTDGVE